MWSRRRASQLMISPIDDASVSRAATAQPVNTSVWISVSFGPNTQSDAPCTTW